MDTRLFHKRLSESTIALIPERTAIVCAVSGGLDSMAMLHGLIAVNQIHDRQWNLRIAHLDHRLRNDSAADADFVAHQAKQLYLPCDVEIADVQSHAEESGETLEEAARRIRYAFLTSIAERCGAQLIATAHHAAQSRDESSRDCPLSTSSGNEPPRPRRHASVSSDPHRKQRNTRSPAARIHPSGTGGIRRSTRYRVSS